MADQKLSALTDIGSLTDDDIFYVVNDPLGTPASKKITALEMKSYTGGTPVDNEVVSGSGTSWALTNTPIVGSVKLYGLGQKLMPTTNYSIAGSVITTVDTWNSGEIWADYRK